MHRLQFKFRTDTDEVQRQAVIEQLLQNGANKVRRLFPSEQDEELAALFLAEIKDERREQYILQLLTRLRGIEFAEPEAKRKLIK